jgi:hypothetical protein
MFVIDGPWLRGRKMATLDLDQHNGYGAATLARIREVRRIRSLQSRCGGSSGVKSPLQPLPCADLARCGRCGTSYMTLQCHANVSTRDMVNIDELR